MRHVKSRLIVTALSATIAVGCAHDDDAELGGSSAADTASASRSAIDRQYIVVFKQAAIGQPSAALDRVTSRLAAARDGSKVLFEYPRISGLAAKLSDAQLALLEKDPEVAYIEPDQMGSIDAVHTAPAGTGIDRVDQRQRPLDGLYSDFGNAGQGVHIYIIDTGIYRHHQEFAGRVGPGRDFLDNDNDPADCHGHGTHVASTTAGTQYGIAKQATVHGLRTVDCHGFGAASTTTAAVEYVIEQCEDAEHRCVINMSLGFPVTATLDRAVSDAVAAGVGVAVSAGNSNTTACNQSPARAESVLTVAAVDGADKRAVFSNFGACADVFAPGVSILGAGIEHPTDTHVLSGTSMASPHVAGVLAEYLGAFPDAPAEEAQEAVTHAASSNCVSDERGTPDRLLFNDFEATPFDCANPPVPPDSCVGFCGGLSVYGCFCDDDCEEAGDCCPDKHEVCD